MATLELACPKCCEHFVIDEAAAVAPEGKTVVVRCSACGHSGSVVAFEREVNREAKEAEREEAKAKKEREKSALREWKATGVDVEAAEKKEEKLRRKEGLRAARVEAREQRLERERRERPFIDAKVMWWFGRVLSVFGTALFIMGGGLSAGGGSVSQRAAWAAISSFGARALMFGIVVYCLAGIWLAVLGNRSEG